MESVTITAVDLFCGAGGLTRGLLDAGIDVVAGIDSNGECAYAYEHNNSASFINESVTDIDPKTLIKLFGDNTIRLLCGCAPCQTFSSMNQRNEAGRKVDSRWTLLLEFSRLIEGVKPEYVTMENVPGLLKTDVFESFINTLEASGYSIDYKVINCSDYGIPQHRERLVLLASLFGSIAFPTPESWGSSPRTVFDAIGTLPAIRAGATSKSDRLHSSSRLSAINLKRIKASKPGGTWRDWEDTLVLSCHKKKAGDGYGAVYGRMEWDKPAPTITTQFYNYGSGRFGHPSQNRAISLREGALLQGFPISYSFDDPQKTLGKRSLGRLIGNAVPVGLGYIIGKTLIGHATSNQHRFSEF